MRPGHPRWSLAATCLMLLAPANAPAQGAAREPADLAKLARPVTGRTRWLWMAPYRWLDSHTLLLFKRVPFDAKYRDAILGPIVSKLDLRTGKETPLQAFSKRWATVLKVIYWAELSPDRRLLAMRMGDAAAGPGDPPVVAPLDGGPPIRDHPLLLAIGQGQLPGRYSCLLAPSGDGMWGGQPSDGGGLLLTTVAAAWAGSAAAPRVHLQTRDGYHVRWCAGWQVGRNQYTMLAALAKEGEVYSWRLARYDVPLGPRGDVVVDAKPAVTPRRGMDPTDGREALEVPGREEIILCCMTEWHGVGARRWAELWWARKDLCGFRPIGRIEEPRDTAGFDDSPLFLAVRPDGQALSFILRDVLYVCPLPAERAVAHTRSKGRPTGHPLRSEKPPLAQSPPCSVTRVRMGPSGVGSLFSSAIIVPVVVS